MDTGDRKPLPHPKCSKLWTREQRTLPNREKTRNDSSDGVLSSHYTGFLMAFMSGAFAEIFCCFCLTNLMFRHI